MSAGGDGAAWSAAASGGVDITRLIEDPRLVAQLSPEAVRAVLAASAAMVVQLAALQPVLLARLLEVDGTPTESAEGLLDVEEAAKKIGMSRDWLYRHAKGLPFTRRVGRALRFDRVGLDAWVRARRRN
jgi:excisionase family DNA binding protein